MDTTTTVPVDVAVAPKKRGRPRKVADESVATEVKKGARKASTKSAGKEDAAVGATGVKKTAATKTVKSTTTKTKSVKATTATVVKTSKTKAASEAKKTEGEDVIGVPAKQTSSKILDEVAKTGTLGVKMAEPAVEKMEVAKAKGVEMPKVAEKKSMSAEETLIQKPVAGKTIPIVPSPPSKPNTIPSAPKATPSPPPSKPTPPPPRPTTVPLPRKPINPYTYPTAPSAPAAPRPKPLSAEEIEKMRTEQAIREGRMPTKYKPAARRVVGLMVGIPVVIVIGWDLYKRWDKSIRTKFETVEQSGV